MKPASAEDQLPEGTALLRASVADAAEVEAMATGTTGWRRGR